MITTNRRVRICENNIALSEYLTDYGSQNATYPASNVLDVNRSLKWRSNFCFLITDQENKIYINDSTDKTITLVNGKYSAASLASHIQTQLNALSSNWTVTYSSSTYKFTISNTGTVTLRLSQLTNAAWDLLGYLFTTDQIGNAFISTAPRIHSVEYFEFDMKFPRPADFIALISPINENFGISLGAQVTIQGNNLPSAWDSPAMSVNLEVTEKGAFKFIDDQDSAYRYFRLIIKDRSNNKGHVEFSHLYIGDYLTIDDSNIANGFEFIEEDLTQSSDASSGKQYFDSGVKYSVFNNLVVNAINLDSRDKLINAYNKLGKSTAFYISLDPVESCSNSISDLTKYVYFQDRPTFNHIISSIWSSTFAVREVI